MTLEWHLRSLQGNRDATRPDERVARVAARQFGVVDLDELRGCGLTRKAVMVRVREGRLHPLYKRVYAVGHPNITLRGRFLAAVKACGPGAVLSHYAAAVVWGIVTWDGRYPEVLTPAKRRHLGIRARTTTRLEPVDVRRRYGIPVTSPARTLVDLASILDAGSLRRATNQALSHDLVTIPELLQALRRLGPCRGSKKLAAVLAHASPTRSELEDVVLDLIRAGGLKPPAVNVPLYVGARKIVPDFRWPEQRLVLEADGAKWHGNAIARADDAERQALLEASGDQVIRVDWQQAITKPQQTVKRLKQAGAP